MELISGFSFASPLVLLGLLSLPILWWLLRITPPRPKPLIFPPLRILRSLEKTRESALSSPWWLILLRLAAAALAILALSQPLFSSRPITAGSGPLLLVVDNGWAAGPHWQARMAAITGLIKPAIRRGRPVAIIAGATVNGEIETPRLRQGDAALRRAVALRPLPWANDRAGVLKALERAKFQQRPQIVWLSDGLKAGDIAGSKNGTDFQRGLKAAGASLTILTPVPQNLPKVIKLNPQRATAPDATAIIVRRAPAAWVETAHVRLLAEDGRILARARAEFAAGSDRATTEIRLPAELRNKGVRIDLENENSAAAVILLDERWRRRPVGLVEEIASSQNAQPLLSPTHYLSRALAPFAQVSKGELQVLLKKPQALLLLADIGTLPASTVERLQTWIKKGGVLVRFAGPRMAASKRKLTPVKLRIGNRSLGGAMTWSKPARLAPFPQTGPFKGLRLPGDVIVRRQVLAQPSLELRQKTWAALQDGTPLVTGEARGAGWLVLVHTTANASWSNLALSGLFIDMLRRLLVLSKGVERDGGKRALPAYRSLDGLGQLRKPYPLAQSLAQDLSADAAAKRRPGPHLPPGYYGTLETRRAFNLSSQLKPPSALPLDHQSADVRGYQLAPEVDLKPALLTAVLILLLVDILASMSLRGYLKKTAVAGLVLAILIPCAVTLMPKAANAQDRDQAALNALRETRLAFIVTGDEGLDAMTRAGLAGLSRALTLRTAVEPAPAQALDVEADELTFFPFIYWSISAAQPRLSAAAIKKLKAYLGAGGMLVFDTHDAGMFPAGVAGDWRTQNRQRLRRLLRRLDLPRLTPVPPGHVLTKTFYLMREFPGRFANGLVWVEDQTRPGGGQNANDGVSSVIIGSNDWAAAWAIDKSGRNLASVTPGGLRQRELAYRVGINMVLYTLTGNYKADQVHVPAILERLGQ